MQIEQIYRQEHLALKSAQNLNDFCENFRKSLGLPEMEIDSENESEWAETIFENINYTISRPYEEGRLQEWDLSVPKECNFGISLGILNHHPYANNEKWIYNNLITIVGNLLSNTFTTKVFYHRSWLGTGKNEIKNTIFNNQ